MNEWDGFFIPLEPGEELPKTESERLAMLEERLTALVNSIQELVNCGATLLA